ncbi:hypothetical protein HK104_006156 [Borealophlyctis nickersoniae]|nr:hypothetical protein HK104_006156 [Borealophlyctis nickersoniae]
MAGLFLPLYFPMGMDFDSSPPPSPSTSSAELSETFSMDEDGVTETAGDVVDPARKVYDLSALPSELLEAIFIRTRQPTSLVRTCARFWSLSKKSSIRATWLVNRYGLSKAFEAALRWTRILDEAVVECLIKMVPPIPRYVLQRAMTRFTHANRPDLLIRLLRYGLTIYDDLSLQKPDTLQFRELTVYHHYTTPTVLENKLKQLRILVEQYNFDVNFCKWSSVSGLPYVDVNEGYRAFLSAVVAGNEALVRELLKFNIATHVSPDQIDESRSFFAQFPFGLWSERTLNDPLAATPQWALSLFPNELRSYLTKTADALILATKHKFIEIMRLLLDHDIERWDTPEGAQVLEKALQLAVDENFDDGIQILQNYMADAEAPQKSPTALKKLLIEACLHDKLEDVKRLVTEGARFDIPSGGDIFARTIDPLKHIVINNKLAIVSWLIKNYPFDSEKLTEMLTTSVDVQNNALVRLLLNNRKVRPKVTDRTLRRCIVQYGYETMPLLLREAKRAHPEKLVGGYSTVLKLAERRARDGRDSDVFVKELREYHTSVLKAQGKSNRTKGKGKGKAVAGKGKGSSSSMVARGKVASGRVTKPRRTSAAGASSSSSSASSSSGGTGSGTVGGPSSSLGNEANVEVQMTPPTRVTRSGRAGSIKVG